MGAGRAPGDVPYRNLTGEPRSKQSADVALAAGQWDIGEPPMPLTLNCGGCRGFTSSSLRQRSDSHTDDTEIDTDAVGEAASFPFKHPDARRGTFLGCKPDVLGLVILAHFEDLKFA